MPKMVLSAVHLLLAQAAAPVAAPAPAAAGQSPAMGFLIPVLFAAAFYFLLIAPQTKKKKEHDKMLTALQVGDEIVTTGGIFGVITSVKDDRFVVRIADNTKVELGKAFVHAVLKQPSGGDSK
jgi:preprotein translocase subunit YajC